jgi:tetratricopeptide (TPR) repeat protein
MSVDILDFHISKASELYRLEVFKRDGTELLASTEVSFPSAFTSPFDLGQLEFDGRDPAARVARLTAFGSRLYQKVFTTEVARVWLQHKQGSAFAALCIRLASDASELEAIPWETLFDGEEFLAAGARSTISRLPLGVKLLDEQPPVPAPLRLLALVSSPLDLPDISRLQMEREQEILLEAINDPSGQGRLRADFEDEAKLEILESSLETPYQILHFSGHGIPPASGGGLLLEDARGNSRPTSVADVIHSLERGERSLRLVVLSGCQTARTLDIAGLRDMARGLLRRGIPSIVAMQFSISDIGGLKFAEVFYSRIAAGRPVEIAIHAARRALMLDDDSYLKADALAPVLLAATGDCLKIIEAMPVPTAASPELDLGFFLPLAQLSHAFYGRRSEYRQVRDAILQRNQRAVIIHGIGGIGKTALVSHIAKRLRPRFQGVFAFDCSGGTLAPETIMIDLHRYFEPMGVTTLEKLLFRGLKPDVLANYLSQLLSQWGLLLIFDNFETQLDNTGEGFRIRDGDLLTFITTLVKATATRSHFLFTSRYLFDLDSRRLGPIEAVHLQDLSRPEALSLMQKLPQLGTASHEEKIEALETFGGHPYALVTLDRHCQHRSLNQALADAKNIHGELRKFLAIELNYAQLPDRSCALLHGLAAFRQAVPYDAVEWVLGKKVPLPREFLEQMRLKIATAAELDEGAFAAMIDEAIPERHHAENLDEPIRELMEWGLLTPSRDSAGVAHLSVHALLREFCRDTQNDDAWRQHVRDAAAYYTNRSKGISGEEKSPTTVWAEMEAFELLMEIHDFQDAAELLVRSTELLNRWGFVHYLDSQHRRLLDVLDPKGTAVILHNFGYLLQSRGDYEQALGHYERALTIKEELGNRAGVAISLHNIGMIQQLRGNYEQALEYYKRALKILEELGNRTGVAGSLHQIGRIQQLRGDYEQALDYYERALKIVEELGDRARVATSLHNIGIIQQKRGDYEQALDYYERSLTIKEELGNRAGVASSLGQIGIIQQLQGEVEQALEYYESALKIDEELGNRAGVASSLHNIGMIQQSRGDYEQAMEYYERALKINEELGNRAGLASSLGQIGKLLTETGRHAEALNYLMSALSMLVELQSPEVGITITDLKTLRSKWGEESFDAAWKDATETDVPDWLD